ncbi:MAG TPA: DoxX family protein [Thermoanaerobaculia bacterium]|nr:DoxX family protein [Thermoanaerobaculia bacterium]
MADTGKLILRLAVAILLGFHGLSKLQKGIAWMAGPLHAHHLPFAIGYGVYLAEVLAPILLIVGIFTRPAALVIAFELCVALFLVVGVKTFTITQQTGALGGELQFLYIAAALAIVFLGSGRFALSKGQGRWD